MQEAEKKVKLDFTINPRMTNNKRTKPKKKPPKHDKKNKHQKNIPYKDKKNTQKDKPQTDTPIEKDNFYSTPNLRMIFWDKPFQEQKKK